MFLLGLIVGTVEAPYQFQAQGGAREPPLLTQDLNGDAAQQLNLAGVSDLAEITGQSGFFFRR
ncbi:hypothetical protein QU24_20795 [Pantoea rodasii]|uniref:Uncharacterized protein n=1 Tax=Pantoea rodasii TaxID=1076549 RepID=A0A0B1R0L8_9GAMM|nr:hypothetical protein QU24_20795 [Pantoea rodasii]